MAEAHTQQQPGIRRIGQLAVPVTDVARAASFYRDVLGLRHLFDAPGMAFFECGGVRLMLTDQGSQDHAAHASVFYLEVDDISAASDALVRHGVHFERPPHRIAEMPDHDLWMSFFRDSEGNLLAFMAELPKAG